MLNRPTFRSIAVILLILTVQLSVAQENKAALSLESIFSSTDFISQSVDNVQWNAKGYTFTMRNEDSGLLEIFEHDLASGENKLLISSDMLVFNTEPVPMTRYQWSNDRRFLVITGPVKRTWDSVREAPHWIYDKDNKTVKALADGNTALRNVFLSPAGTHVGYVLENNLYIANLNDGMVRAVTTDGSENIWNGIFDYGSTEFGFVDAWHWSPDGTKIAFWRNDVSDVKVFYMIDELGKYNEVRALKYPNTGEKHAVTQIGVYDLESRVTRWMDTGDNVDDYLPLITWTPSSDKLAIQRLARSHELLELIMADAESGESEVIYSETDPAWIDITNDFAFLHNQQRFVWTSEKSGYRHAYIYDYDGNEKQLTSGEWEVVSLVGVDEERGWLYFYAKKDGFTEQHVYRVSVEGSDVQKLSGNPGWYHWNLSPDGRHAIQHFSTASTPPTITLIEAPGKTIRTLVTNDLIGLSKYDVPNPEFFQFENSDGIVLNAYFIKPSNFDAQKKYPVIAFGYGNAGSQMVINRWAGPRGMQRDFWHRYMAQQGYIIFSMDNRTTTGRGKKAKNLTYGHYGKWAVIDQLEGVEYLKTLPYVDAERIGFWGWSGGGYLAAALMTKGAPHYKTAVSVAPVIDLLNYQATGVERWMDFYEDNPDGYAQVNLLNYADKLEGNLLLIHGSGDENVKFAFTLQFADALIKAGKQFDMMVYPNEHHGIEGARLHVYTKIADYFKEKL